MEDLYRKHEDRSRGGKFIRDSVYIRISFAQQNLSQAVYEIVHAQARHGIGGVNESAEEVTQIYACGQVTRGSTARDKSIHYERTKGKWLRVFCPGTAGVRAKDRATNESQLCSWHVNKAIKDNANVIHKA